MELVVIQFTFKAPLRVLSKSPYFVPFKNEYTIVYTER